MSGTEVARLDDQPVIARGQYWCLTRPSLAGYPIGATVEITNVVEDGVGYQYLDSGARGVASHRQEFRSYFEPVGAMGRTEVMG